MFWFFFLAIIMNDLTVDVIHKKSLAAITSVALFIFAHILIETFSSIVKKITMASYRHHSHKQIVFR